MARRDGQVTPLDGLALPRRERVCPPVQPGGLDDEGRAAEVGASEKTKKNDEHDHDDQGGRTEGGDAHGTIVPFSRSRWLE
jgi:hypothetical protein